MLTSNPEATETVQLRIAEQSNRADLGDIAMALRTTGDLAGMMAVKDVPLVARKPKLRVVNATGNLSLPKVHPWLQNGRNDAGNAGAKDAERGIARRARV